MNLSKTDISIILRYLEDAAKFYKWHAVTARERDRIRLINKMIKKLRCKIEPPQFSLQQRINYCGNEIQPASK